MHLESLIFELSVHNKKKKKGKERPIEEKKIIKY